MERSKKKTDALLLAFTAWMADRRPRPLRPSSRTQYVRWIRRALDITAAAEKSLMGADLRTLRFVLGKVPVHPASQNGMTNALRLFFVFLKDQGIRKDNPALELGRPPRMKTSPRPLSMEAICRYLDAAWELSPVHLTIACLGLYMGLRCDEIRTRQWTDFFEADGRLWCDIIGKGGKFRREPVHAEIRRAIERLRGEHNDARWLFPSPFTAKAGEPASTSFIRSRHLEILDKAGLPHCRLHDLRHSFATYLRKNTKADVSLVQKGLGHSSPETTMVYMEVLDEELAEHIDRLDFRKREAEGA